MLGMVLLLSPVLLGQSSGRFLGDFALPTTELSRIPDNSPARIQAMDYILAPLSEIGPQLNRVITDPFMAPRVQFRVEQDRQRGLTYLLFENEIMDSQTLGKSFPLSAAGNFVIRRNHRDGKIDQIKFFLGQGPHVFLRFFPMGQNQSRASFFAYNDNVPLFDDLILPVNIERLLSLPTRDLLLLLSGNRQWSRFLVPEDLEEYTSVQQMVKILRPLLPTLPDAEDGAMDENGMLMKIESLLYTGLPGFNCSGFAKWVADGVYYQMTGRFMGIEELKEKHLDLRGSALGLEFEDLRDPYFGLDWTRNIARVLSEARYGVTFSPEDLDVREVPFFEYIEDKGYEVSDLWQTMYLLALTDPGAWYLGSVNGEFGSSPVLWQHYHVVTFFPYFDSNGLFRVVVMERNVESGIDSLIRRYPRDYMHLVRLPTPQGATYAPPIIHVQ